VSRRPSRSRLVQLPLDDPRWVPLANVHRLFQERLGSPHLAATDLTEALRSPRLRSMVRYMPRERIHRPELPKRKLWSADDWDQHEIQYWSDGLLVAVKQPSRGVGVQVLRVYGYFFVWEPDVKEFFGDKTTTSKPGSAAAWVDELCPNGEWRTMTGKQLHQSIERKAKERKLNKWPSLRAVQNELSRRRRQT
jgi:hypothetical protein